MHRAAPPSARISANAGVVQQRRRRWLKPKSLKINERSNAGVAGGALQNRGLQVRFLPGLFSTPLSHRALSDDARRLCYPDQLTAPWIAPWPEHSGARARVPPDRNVSGHGQDAHLTTETKEFDEGRTYRPLREQ